MTQSIGRFTLTVLGILAGFYLLAVLLTVTDDDRDVLPFIPTIQSSVHHHSTFLIYINGNLKRLDDAKYYGASKKVHIHDYSFAEIHTHAANITLGQFLNTLQINLSATCVEFENEELYCGNETHKLRFYIDGEPNGDIGNHFTADFEQYLIIFGDETEDEITEQIDSVPEVTASNPPTRRAFAYNIARNPL